MQPLTQPLLATDRPLADIGRPFQIHSEFQPAGDQPQAIAALVDGVARGERDQVLLGVTGSGKTFTMAHVIQQMQRPALILAPNKTLAAQLYGEMKSFFPENAVEYFVSYYDYYQPEAYVAAHRHLHREGILDQRADRPHAPLGDAGDPGAPRHHHRGLGLLHLRHRLGGDLCRHDPRPRRRRERQPQPDPRQAGGAAVPAQRHQLRARRLPGARRHHRALPGALRGPRLAHLAVRRRGRGDPRVRSPHRREDRGARDRSRSIPTATTSRRSRR